MSSLRDLNLQHCQVTNSTVEHIVDLKLTALSLSNCLKITDYCLSLIRSIKTLTQLDLSMCPFITDDGIQHLALLPLTRLSLSCCDNVQDRGVQHLSALTKLNHLSLRHLHVTDVGIRSLEYLPLRSLDLRYTKVSDQGLQIISVLPLRRVDVSNCRYISRVGLSKLIMSVASLLRINVSNCTGVQTLVL